MCNEFQLRAPFANWWADHGRAAVHDGRPVPVAIDGAQSNRPPDLPFKPTKRAIILRPQDPTAPIAGLEAVQCRWWLVPFFHKGTVSEWRAMCTNAKIETVDSLPTFREAYKHRRALVPITSFIEYDEPPGWRKGQPKRRLEATWARTSDFDEIRYFAGIWDRSTPSDLDGPLESFAFITGPPGPDVEAAHDRDPALLTFQQGLDWLRLDGPGKAGLVTAPPAGTYRLAERPRELDQPA